MNRKPLLIGVIIVLAIGIVIMSGAWFFVGGLSRVSDDTTPAVFVVSQGESVETIANNLFEAGLIKNPTALKWYVWSKGLGSNIQAGKYQLYPAMKAKEVIDLLTAGDTESNEREITTLEGWSSELIGEYFEKEEVMTKAEWLAAVSANDSRELLPDETYAFLSDKPESASLEGYLFPDTYRIFKDATPASIVRKMLDNFSDKVSAERLSQIRSQGKTLFEILTIASIIEREVLNDKDKRMAADVFWKRLDEGIPLQSDATVNYVTGKDNPRPTLEDLQTDSPYNTYKYRGLPPGPIGNPGISAIIAAIEPESNPYYYFLTTADGTAIFSRTLDEHNANKAKYLD